jgi:hypothetical protein
MPVIGSFGSSLSALSRFVGYRTERLADQNRILPAALASVFVSLTYPNLRPCVRRRLKQQQNPLRPTSRTFQAAFQPRQGKPAPRVQTNLCRSSSAPWTHSRTRFIPSRRPYRPTPQCSSEYFFRFMSLSIKSCKSRQLSFNIRSLQNRRAYDASPFSVENRFILKNCDAHQSYRISLLFMGRRLTSA